MRSIPRPRLRRQRGSALIEFAITFVILFPLMAGVFEFGYAFFIYNQLKNAVREGSRYASLITYDSATATYSDAFGNAVRNMAVYGNPAGGTTPNIPRLTTAHVALSVTFTNGVPAAVTVSIRGYSLDTIFKTFVLNKPSCTFPYVGRYAPIGT